MNRKNRKIRIGAVGGGIYGTATLRCFAAAQRRGSSELVCLADIDENILAIHEKQFGLKGYLDYREMFAKADLDAVSIATPDDLHSEVVVAAANAGLHVLVQKPLDTSTIRARRMIDACRENGVMLYVDFHKRIDPAHMRLKQDIAMGKLGKIQYGYVCMEDKIVVPSGWLRKWAARSSPSWFLGVHFYDLVCWLTAARPLSVYASGYKGKLQSMGIDSFDSISARVQFDNGATVTFDTSWILPDSFPSIVNQQLRFVGDEGIVEIDSQDRGMFCAYSDMPDSQIGNPFGAVEYQHPVWGQQVQGYTFLSMIRFLELIQAIQSGEASLQSLDGAYPDGQQALIATQIGEAIDKSVTTSRIVKL